MNKKLITRLTMGLVLLALLATLLPMSAYADETVDVGDFTVTGGIYGTDYDYLYGFYLQFNNPGTYEVSMRSGVTSTSHDIIYINAPGSSAANPVRITLNNVDIQYTATAISIISGSTAELTLVGTNTLRSKVFGTAINVEENSSVTIGGSGLLSATSNDQTGIGATNNCGNITITGGTIIATGGTNGAGIGGNMSVGSVTITGGTVSATGGDSCAGIGGEYGFDGGSVTISGGHVTARGGTNAAGIGGSNGGNGGSVNITGGTINAMGDSGGAGIGGGDAGNGGSVTISGGTITSTGGSGGADIGGGRNGDGADVVISGGSINGAWIGAGYGGSSEGTLMDGDGHSLLVDGMPYPLTLTLKGAGAGADVGSLIINGTAYGTSGMTTDANERVTIYIYIMPIFSTGSYAVTAEAGGKSYEGELLTSYYYPSQTLLPMIESDGTYVLADYYAPGGTLLIRPGLSAMLTDDGTARENYQIQCGAGASLTLSGVNIDNSATDPYTHADLYANACPLSFTGTDNMLTLAGVNTMKAGRAEPGVRVETGTELAIGGTGSLNATGGQLGAGIGGYTGGSGTVNITGGTINATGGQYGAGIGGGFGGIGGSIGISGGTVTATGGSGGAGIGGGSNGDGGTVNITGGTINATGGQNGAGIGGGYEGSGGSIGISGGTVTATGGGSAAGIGGGYEGSGGEINLSGGVVFARGDKSATIDAHDVGSAHGGSGGTLSLSGTAALFLYHDYSLIPETTTHTHVDVNDTTDDMYGIANTPSWASPFGAYLRIYTLAFNVNGGTGTLPESYTALYGWEVMVPDGSELSRTGYTFSGWNTQADGGGTPYAVESIFTYDATATLYAQWTREAGGTTSRNDDTPPHVVTGPATDVTVFGATLSGEVLPGSSRVTERGFVIGTNGNPAIGQEGVIRIAAGSGTGSFTAAPWDLAQETVYYVRAYAISTDGVGYGASIAFQTADFVIPKTGDGCRPAGWIVCGALAAVHVMTIAWYKRRRAK